MKRANRGFAAVRPFLSSEETHSRSQMAAATKRKAELRAKKVQRIKKQIEEGTYDVSAADVVRGVARSEISWLLNMEYTRSHGVR